MPNGTSAPGNVFPPLLVQVRVSTIVAGLLTAPSVFLFLAPAGSCACLRTGGHAVGLPSGPFTQLAGFFGVNAGAGLAGPGGALVDGTGDGVAVGDGAAVAAGTAAKTMPATASAMVAVPRIARRRLARMVSCRCFGCIWSPPSIAAEHAKHLRLACAYDNDVNSISTRGQPFHDRLAGKISVSHTFAQA